MLALNSYGLAPRSAVRSNNNSERVTLPRLCGGGLPAVREIRSLDKLDFLARKPEHPLFRTTTGYDYGRFIDFKDVALSCPKHAKPAGFTKEFIAGNYCDHSLLSLDNNRQRVERWQQKMVVRTTQMRVKYEELQQVLEERKELRRIEREKRRREMEVMRSAVIHLQALARGFIARLFITKQKLIRDTEAAKCIQQASRARARVRMAKQIVEARRRERQNNLACKIQLVVRNYILRELAKRQLLKLREVRRQREIAVEQEALRQRADAASQIQRVARGHLARKDFRRQSSIASSMVSDKDEKDTLLSITGRMRSRGARRVIAQMQQVRRRTTKVSVRAISTPPTK
ncbi:hypothetical protein PHYBOEH_003679 [Phytophthora boehmeriae]|uniref:Uncharacterized protein n=1 Tax=Phytophthora boehmeriae TaxID=109152 RepID=A0A8T1WUQ6_9STRA|nr:hypothetical protein PHYBOEH_003679 [Phytophthora boehmeriae]